MARTCVQIYFSSRRMLSQLDDAQLGRVFSAVMDYAADGVEPCGLAVLEQTAFESLRVSIDRDAESYDRKCQRMQQNGAKGGRPKKEEKPKNQLVIKKPNRGANSSSNSSSSSISSLSSPTPSCEGGAEDAPCGATTTITDPLWTFWNENAGKLTPYHKKRISEYRRKGCGDDLILLAMERAVEQGVLRMSYVTAILDNALAVGALTAKAYSARGKAIGARDGASGQKPMQDMFHRDWNAVFDKDEDDGGAPRF